MKVREFSQLAVTVTKDHPQAAAFVDAVNTLYGYPDTPIGVVRNGAAKEAGKFNLLADKHPHDLKSGADAPEAGGLIKDILAKQPDGSVVIAQVGFSTNLVALLDSPADAIAGDTYLHYQKHLAQIRAWLDT